MRIVHDREIEIGMINCKRRESTSTAGEGEVEGARIVRACQSIFISVLFTIGILLFRSNATNACYTK